MIRKIEQEIYEFIKINGPIQRGPICSHFELPRTTIYDYLVKLMEHNMVIKYPLDKEDRSRGRPPTLFEAIV